MRKNTLTAALAIALFAAAGTVFWLTRPDNPRAIAPAATNSLDPSTGEPRSDQPPSHNLLVREIFRQALLIAERNAALPARDRVLEGAIDSTDDDPNLWDITADLIPHVGIDLRLRRRGQSTADWKTLIPYKNNWLDHLDLAERANQYLLKEFPSTLAAPAPTAAPPSTAPALNGGTIEYALGQINFISAFTAIRAAHAVIRARGESPEALGALARGYANLGQLTLFTWNATPKALAARSMLYAQRMIDLWPQSPLGFWHRAYAVAFAGHQGRALQDLDAADRLAASASPAIPTPPWVPLLRHFCRYESSQLAQAAADLSSQNSSLAPLAQLLLFLSIESCDSPSFVNSIGQATLQDNPDCFRVLDRMIEVSGVSFNHQLTVYGPTAMMQSLATRLQRLPDLPAPARDALNTAITNPSDLSNWAALTTALIELDAPPGDELPWRALGQIIRETQFVQVWRRTNFIANSLASNAADEVSHFSSLVQEHPYFPFIQLHAYSHPAPAQKRAILKDVRIIDPVQTMATAFSELHSAQLRPPPSQQEPGQNLSYSQWAIHYRDNTSFDLERNLRLWRYSQRDLDFLLYETRELARESPHSPLYMAKMIEYNWADAEPLVPQWLSNRGDHPLLTGALGKHYTTVHDWPQAERHLTAYLAKAPDLWARRMLALAQFRQQRDAQGIATLQAGLQQPDYALDHATLNYDIAWHHIAQRKFQQAKPFAYEAASSYSSFGLTCAAHVEECLAHWDIAEDFIRRDAERYDQAFNYLSWCARTAHGDQPAAKAAWQRQLRNARNDLAGREATVQLAAAYLFDNDSDKALHLLRQSAQQYNDTWSAMQAILLDANDPTARQKSLRQLIDVAAANAPIPGKSNPQTDWVRPDIADLAKLWLNSPDNASLDLAKAEQLVQATAPQKERLNLNYFIGRILQTQGNRDAAVTYLRRAAGPERYNTSVNCTLAWIQLRALGLDPLDLYNHPADPDAIEE